MLLGQDDVPEIQNEKHSTRAPLEKVWEFETHGNIGDRLVTDDLVFLACADKWLYALDVTSGQQRWAFDIGVKIQVFGLVREGNTLYVSGENNVLYSIDAETGKLRWQFATTMPYPPVFGNGLCFTVNAIKKGSELCAIDSQTGLERWRFSASKNIWYPAVGHGCVFFGTANKRIHALDISTGESRWEAASRHDTISRPTVARDTVVVCENSHLRAYNANSGALLWEIKDAGAISHKQGPTVVGDHVLLPNELTLVNLESGVVSKKLSPGTNHGIERVDENTVYTVCSDGALSAIDLTTGEWKWYAIIESKWPHYFGWDKSENFVFAAAPSSHRTFAFDTSRFTRRWDFPDEARGSIPYVAGKMVIAFSYTLASNKRKVYGYAGSIDPAKQAVLEIGEEVAQSPEYIAPVLLTAFTKGVFGGSGQFAWPEFCCLCLGPVEKHVRLGETVDKVRLMVEGVPYCAECYKETMKGMFKKNRPGVEIVHTRPPTFAFRNERYWAMFMESNRAR